jgi:PAS domain S-box-containing protein
MDGVGGMTQRAPVDLLEAFKFALDQAAIVAITDTAGRITYANDYFCRISKYSRDELLGQDHRLVNSAYHPKEFMRSLWDTIRAGRVWKGEIRNRAKDGTLYWVDTTIVPFIDEAGKPWQYLAIRADITERKRAEHQLFEQGALVKLGEMASVVAHEVKNPLAGIAGAIQVIAARLPEGSPERGVVKEILVRIAALNATVEDLLLFSRPRAPRPGALALSSLLEATASLLARDPQTAGVQVESHVEDVALWGDPEMLKAVLHNVLLNGAQAMGGQGRIRITSRAVGGFCELGVADAGPGIAPELRERVFEPFGTTKHRGTGLGLSIARRVMEAHGGSIRLECPVTGGTVVTLALPLHPERSSPPGGGVPAPATERHAAP